MDGAKIDIAMKYNKQEHATKLFLNFVIIGCPQRAYGHHIQDKMYTTGNPGDSTNYNAPQKNTHLRDCSNR